MTEAKKGTVPVARAVPLSKPRLEPRVTPGHVPVPHLKAKIEWLCAYHPRIKTQNDVAGELGISPSVITQWIKGTDIEDGRLVAPLNTECIPTRHYPAFQAIWGVPSSVIEMPDLAGFRAALETHAIGLGPWSRLVKDLPDDPTVELLGGEATRGVIGPDDYADPDLAHFRVGGRIMIRVPNPDHAHGAMLMQDRHGLECLFPSGRSPDTSTGETMVYPAGQIPGEPPRFGLLVPPGGLHRVIAILTTDRLPDTLLDVLMSQSMAEGSLNGCVHLLNRMLVAGTCRLVSRRFLVLP